MRRGVFSHIRMRPIPLSVVWLSFCAVQAATHYYDIVDQMTRGHAFLLETFGVKPTIGWHIGTSTPSPPHLLPLPLPPLSLARCGLLTI